MTPNSTEERVALPSQGKVRMLLSMVEHDIARDGETASFMVRAGLLRDILKYALTRTDNDVSGLVEALEMVLAYREGKPPFDFHRLPDDHRANEAFDAWQNVEAQIRTALAKHRQSNGGVE